MASVGTWINFPTRTNTREKGRGIPMGKTIGDFGRAKNPVQEAVAEFFVRSADARHLDDVNARAENHTAEIKLTQETVGPATLSFPSPRPSPRRRGNRPPYLGHTPGRSLPGQCGQNRRLASAIPSPRGRGSG